MLNSYFDLAMSPPNIQKAAADTFAKQQKGRLAVLPAANLADAAKTGMASRQAGQNLALAERKLALDTEKQAFDASQTPWAIAGGALGAAAQLYGGYRALEDAKEMKQLYGDARARNERFLDEMRGTSGRTLGKLDEVTTLYNRPLITPKPAAAPMTFNFARPNPYALTFTP